MFQKIKKDKIIESLELQYDYFSAYLDFYTGYPNFKIARDISEKYLDYPSIYWRNLFYEIANQLAEHDGEEDFQKLKSIKENESKTINLENAKKEENLTASLNGKTIVITHQNVKEITINYYSIDLEVLFSRNPFLTKNSEDFSFIKSNFSEKHDFKNYEDLEKCSINLPSQFEKKNVFIQIRAFSKTVSLTYFSTSLQVQVMENYGQIKVSNIENKPLTKVFYNFFKYYISIIIQRQFNFCLKKNLFLKIFLII